MEFKKFYRLIIKNFKYTIQKLLLSQTMILLFMFFIAYSNNMGRMEFLEYLFMMKYKAPIFIGLYTAFISVILVIFFSYVEVIDITNLKEFALRVNDNRKTKKVLCFSIIVSITFYIFFIFILSIILSFLLRYEALQYTKLFISQLLYTVFFISIVLCYYLTHVHELNKNIAYITFLFLHLNNVFSLIPWISIPKLVLDFGFSSCITAITIYVVSCALMYIFSLKNE
ncbi:hypothetical protein ACOAKC_04345 [Hathewaya histolytica]|uniref:hypothetical protein n=1 Tax=Hathewaya histolytica TaxID=1498 RepID=UPI003B675551